MRASLEAVLSSCAAVLVSFLLAGAPLEAGPIEVEAVAGEPFGVGKITVDLDSTSRLLPDSPLQLVDAQGRVLYPAFQRTMIRVPTAKDARGAGSLTAYFLFRGNERLELDLRTDASHRATARPIADDAAHRKLLGQWWGRYTGAAHEVAKANVYQPLVENYLTATLARRLNLNLPKRSTGWTLWSAVDETVALISGAESVRTAAQSKVLLEGTEATEVADRPLPKPATAPSIGLPATKEEAAIEPIAMHVPVECFYVRCGSFANFMWLRSAIADWGTNLRHLASVRGLDYRINTRIERQLALKETVLGRLLGDTVISDVVILGTDAFLRAGPAIGVIFEARNTEALGYQISQQRADALSRHRDAKETTVRIAGHEVSLVATPDNQVRSFYAVNGRYHLVTTSRTLVKRFFEAGRGERSLGKAAAFRWARSLQPLAENHTVFVYLSDPFFRMLISPQYRIEMTRRVAAASEIDVVRLAQLAARAEGSPAATVRQLVACKLLPEGFGRRPDGSHVVVADGRVTDSLRGAYGSFLPVPDVEITGATPSEAKAYEAFAQRYRSLWRRMDPVIVGVKRRVVEEGAKQRVTFDVHITPYARSHYQFLTGLLELGSADKQRWLPVPGDIASIEANVFGGKLCAGMRDLKPHYVIKDGSVHFSPVRDEDVPFYFLARRGDAPDWFYKLRDNNEPADEDGDVRVHSLFSNKGWLRRLPEADLIAPRKEVLNEVAPHVKLAAAERSAKGRLRIADLREAEVAATIDAESYIRARKVSAGNVHLMHALMQQFHVPAKDAKTVAENLLDAGLVCPLGGQYHLKGSPSGLDHWRSTAWKRESLYQESRVPEGFQAPVLEWFAGLLLEMNIDRTMLSSHIELDVRAKKQ